MSMYIHATLPYPFKTAGTEILYVLCIICDNMHASQAFFPSSRLWSSGTYRWDRYEDLNKMSCPSCGAIVPNSVGRRITNFLMEMAYDRN